MSIPKVIHYCWFGGGKMPRTAVKCINSWKKFCPDYEIICWNEENFDFTQNKYAYEAYKSGKWAFVSDYARLKVTYDHGGVYFDTDVELIRPIDDLLESGGYMGFDEMDNVSTGLGFACDKGDPVVGAILKDYDDISFILPDGEYDITPCPARNTRILRQLGMDTDVKKQNFMGMNFYPRDYFCPVEYCSGRKTITDNTYSIHHYCALWTSAKSKRTTFIKHIIGVKMYEKLYGKFLHKLNWLEW